MMNQFNNDLLYRFLRIIKILIYKEINPSFNTHEMKKIIFVPFMVLCLQTFAQSSKSGEDDGDNNRKGGFKKEKLFTGGSLTAGFSNYATVLGISPQFGYSLTNWADAGITINYNYTSQRDYYEYGDKLRQTVYGPGAFIRLFPVNFLFATAQYEFNWIHLNYIPAPNGTYTAAQNNVNANSLLLGFGYAGGRYPGSNTYYYFSVSWDVLGEANSPYVDGLGRADPVFRIGYNIGLFQGPGRRNYQNN
jgi:hypothetical protein